MYCYWDFDTVCILQYIDTVYILQCNMNILPISDTWANIKVHAFSILVTVSELNTITYLIVDSQ